MDPRHRWGRAQGRLRRAAGRWMRCGGARRGGVRVTAEATPHHLVLTDEAVRAHDYDPIIKMNPPLRSEEDRKAVIAGLLDGTIDAIATDHAPHTLEEKAREYFEAPSGLPLVQQFLLPSRRTARSLTT